MEFFDRLFGKDDTGYNTGYNTELETESETASEGREDTEAPVDESQTEAANEDVVDDTSSEEVSPNETVETEEKEKESFIPGVATSDDGFENNYTTPMDFSWLDEKAKDVSTMTAQAGVPSEERKKEDGISNDELKKQINDFADLSGEVQGLFTKEEIQAISDKINDKPNAVQNALGTVADFLVPFAGKEIRDTIAPPQMENPKAYVEALVRFKENNPNGYAESKKALDEAYEGSRKGSFTHGLDYYSMTGDTNGNAYAKHVDSIIKSLPEDTPKEVINAILNPDPITREKINTLSMEAEKNAKVKALAIEEASTVTAAVALGLAAPYIKSGVGKLMEKLPEGLGTKIAEKMAKITLRGERGQEFWDNLMNKTVESNGSKFKLGDLVSLAQAKSGKYAYNLGNALQTDASQELMGLIRGALEESGLRVIEKGAEAAGGISMKTLSSLVADAAVESGFGKKAATVGGLASLATAANAVPTGIFDESGKMIDSKEIVKERQENPYTGEDKVTLQSREGSVTVDPREAVIVGESESLTPTQGYTEEVKKLAQEEKREVYEKEPVEMIQPTQHDLSVFDKAVDYVQAILGGRDLNNDKTITNSEWYQSTIGPVVESMKETFSLPDLKSVAKDVGNKVERFVDRVGGNIAASIPGVINLSTGEIQVVDREVPATEDMAKLLQTKVVDSLPSWGDDAQSDAMKSVVANTVMDSVAPMYGNVGVITLVKAAGAYATETIAEICHLNDYDLSNDQKGAINFAITNAIGLTFEPVSTIIRDVTSGYGILQRGKIEATFSGETPSKSETLYIVPYEGGGNEVDSQYGIGKERVDADTQYSGYREQAKESNVATDYNRGLEKNVNTAVSDKYAKNFMVMLQNEPGYIRKVLMDIPKRRGF